MKFIFAFVACLASTIVRAQVLTLEEALQKALSTRQAVQAATKAVASARQGLRASGALPGLTLGAGHSSHSEIGATDQDLFVSLPIDIFGRTSAARKVGAAGLMIAEADLQLVLLDVQLEVLSAYVAAYSAERQAIGAQGLLEIAESIYAATLRRFEEGKIPEVQLTRARIERDRFMQAAALRKAEFQSAQRRLAGALGADSIAWTLAPPQIPDPAPDLERLPDLMRLRAQALQSDAQAQLASASLSPEFEVIGARSPWRDERSTVGARLQLTWRFFDFGRARHESDAARLQAASYRDLLEDRKALAVSAIQAIDLQIAAERQRTASYESIRAAAVDLVEKSQRGFSEGIGTLIDVLEATRALREIERELAEAELSLHLALIAKYRAAGRLLGVAR